MNSAQIHLLVNHMPLATLIFAFFILVWGRVRNDNSILQVGLVLLVVGGAFALAAFLTGEDAEAVVKSLPGFSRDLAHEHELAAKFGLTWTLVTAFPAAFALYRLMKVGSVPRKLLYAVMFFNLFTLTVLARTNHLGGQVSHAELRN